MTPATEATGQGSSPSIALVLSGGGARGAYEIGALSVLAPVLEARGEDVAVLVGTSVGALNAAYLGATAHLPLVTAVGRAVEVWRSMSFGDVLRPLLSRQELRRAVGYLGEVIGVPGASVSSILDPRPLRDTLSRVVDFGQLARNVDAGAVGTVAVVATSYATTSSTVFHAGGTTPPDDQLRAIDYVQVRLGEAHVRASAAIPGLFPAVRVEDPPGRAGWYSDGGLRLNAPLRPALDLGAQRVVVIGMNSPSTPADALPDRPDAIDGGAQLAQVVLADQLTDDVLTLATVNEMLMATPQPTPSAPVVSHRRIVPYIFVSPPARFTIGRLAADIYDRCYSGLRGLLRSKDLMLLGEVFGAKRSVGHAELLSYLFFAPEFLGALVEQGRNDARHWLAVDHDDGPWQRGVVHLPATGTGDSRH